MSLKTINLTFGRHISVDEVLHYTPHPADPQKKTLLKQEATINVQGVPLSYYMEDIVANHICANANKGRQGLEWVISKINCEVKGIADAVSKSTDDIIHLEYFKRNEELKN
ncbi:protein slowmo [Contarinia nasturtii]|uniref:protein slowmo n=1 Tax=Contarinia nasturtii TaxID=265458 RepID=UPI0012D389D7|nr:protein slowmo [Contarinia nasturtii]